MLTTARCISMACGLSLALGGAAAAQFPAPQGSARSPSVLAVPYIAQSELLCGGAALAMVERFWGRRGVYAENFTALVHPELHGILTTDLTEAARLTGWRADSLTGNWTGIRRKLGDSIPVIALIQVARNRYHYIVLLGWSPRGVTYHDPAVGPFRTMTESQFIKAWTGGQRWAIAVRPRPDLTPDPGPLSSPDALTATSDSLPCRPFLDLAIDAVGLDSLDRAATLLANAETACPAEPTVLRELAGVRFRQRRFADAERLAVNYVAAVPSDTLGWELLASSRYRLDDKAGALDAWNAIGKPTVDLVRIDGVRRIRFSVIAIAIGIRHGSLLTHDNLTLARRRVAELPAFSAASIGYQPVPGGLVEVRAAVAERPLLPPLWALAAAQSIRALGQHEIGVSLATPLGAGELWSGTWRWDHAHPLVDFQAEIPLRLGVPGVIGFDGGWERFRFAPRAAADSGIEETRRAGSVTFGGWVNRALRPSIGLRLEHWSGNAQYLAGIGGLEFRAAGDRFSLRTTAEQAAAIQSGPGYSRGSLRTDWASSFGLRRASWSVRAGIDLASRTAPLGVQPMASGDLPLAIPLRAHPWTRDGVIPTSTIGRTIVHGGVSADQPLFRTGLFTVAAGIFLDGADVGNPADGSGRSRFYLDAGGGIRIGILNGQLGVIRVDLATGLIDRTTALTVGLHQEWPTFRDRAH